VQLQILHIQQLVLYRKNDSGTIPVITVSRRPVGVFALSRTPGDFIIIIIIITPHVFQALC
jgi:hypothetical protein